jgi:hypothetical protein
MFTACTTPPPAKKTGVVQRLKPAKSNIYARPRAGLFFCLASNTVQGFYFTRRRISHAQAFTAAFLSFMQFIQPKRQNRLHGFTVAFPLIWPISAPQYSRHTSRLCTTCATPDAVQVSTAAYYNKVYKGAWVRHCHRSMPDKATHRRLCQSGGAEPLTATAASLFGLSPDS